MKKLTAVLLCVFICITGCAFADLETGMSDFTYEELLAIQRLLSLEAMSRPEWKETTVPSGTWIVGVDIPSGNYSISPTERGGYLRIRRDGYLIITQGVRKEEDAFWKFELKEGDEVEITSGSLVFAPPRGLDF